MALAHEPVMSWKLPPCRDYRVSCGPRPLQEVAIPSAHVRSPPDAEKYVTGCIRWLSMYTSHIQASALSATAHSTAPWPPFR